MPDSPPKPKRKRGRPRKNPVDPPKVSEPSVEAMAEAAAAEAASPEPEPAINADVPPSGERSEGSERRPRRKRISKAMTQQIEDGLAEILQIPAVPASLLGDQWAAAHFTNQGRALANRIAVVSERNPVLRGWCERAIEGESIAVLLMAGVMYAAPPLMHLGVLPGGEMLGIPVLRRAAPEPEPVPSVPVPDENANLGREVPEPQPYGGAPVEPEFSGAENNGEPPTWQAEMLG